MMINFTVTHMPSCLIIVLCSTLVLQKPTAQSAISAATNAASPNQVPPSASGLQPGATGPLAISQITSALKCKLPNCPKPCYMEVNGHVHDFCSKAHAVTYFQQQSQQQSQQPMAQSPGAPTTMSKGTPSLYQFAHQLTCLLSSSIKSSAITSISW